MPPTLDLSRATPADFILHTPRMGLRRGGTYAGDKGPLSSTSSRFSFNHLIASPPASPSLPALIPRHGKPLPSRAPKRVIRSALWSLSLLSFILLGLAVLRQLKPASLITLESLQSLYEMVGDADLPDVPTPIVLTDTRGQARWTVSIPSSFGFPLHPTQYWDICQGSRKVSKLVRNLRADAMPRTSSPNDYYRKDPDFLDVLDAEKDGILKLGLDDNSHLSSLVGLDIPVLKNMPACRKSLTVVLESSEAGLGPTMMMLWIAYGLAAKEGRAFFIDDSRW